MARIPANIELLIWARERGGLAGTHAGNMS